MMKRGILLNRFKLLSILLLTIICYACTDEPLFEQGASGGKSKAKVCVEFKSLSTTSLGARGNAGDAIKDIVNLHILIYDAAGNFISWQNQNQLDNYKNESGYTDSEDSNESNSAEAKTDRATFDMEIGYGTYKIYAVANVADDIIQPIATEGKTDTDLKNLSFSWNQTDISANRQMFGSFQIGESSSTSYGMDATVLTINQPSVSLHAWIKRLASKVTVAYDGTNLKDNVYIYLKSVQIKDIPQKCYLGQNNQAQAHLATGAELTREAVLYADAQGTNDIIYYTDVNENGIPVASHLTWPCVAKGNPYYYVEAADRTSLKSAHTETTTALFFYENMQGSGQNMPDKRQDANNDKLLDDPGIKGENDSGFKDDVKFGTYIEVKAYYVNAIEGKTTSGDIVYRFMLGKDVINDYNAERNTHYKLTLNFNGEANDVDWHIEYQEEPGIKLPNPYYISYNYNDHMQLPVRVVPGSGQKVGSIKVEIIENHWWPEGANDNIYYGAGVPSNQGKSPQLYNGFLSLGFLNTSILDPANASLAGNVMKALGTNEDAWNGYELGKRIYNVQTQNGDYTYTPTVTATKAPNDLGGTSTYNVSTDPNNNEVSFKVPFYTLPKTLTTTTGFTGANIYFNNERLAEVKFTAYTGPDGTGDVIGTSETIEIRQVKRLENPNGVWRAHNSAEAFNVRLLAHNANATEGGSSSPFRSVGPWRVYVESATDENGTGNAEWITINGKSQQKTNETIIEGATNSYIQFSYAPGGTIRENQTRCGVIVVEYNNYTCQHRIYVRQGYAPLAIVSGGSRWHSFNSVTKTTQVSSPMGEGSMFKFGNWDNPIDENNSWPDKNFIFQQDPGANGTFNIAGSTKPLKWSEIAAVPDGFSDVTNEKTRVASSDDWMDLRSSDVYYDFGILYADGVTAPLTSDAEATQYRDIDGYRNRGMRGCFVYNKKTGAQLFFPIGATGYGRRKNYINGDKNGELKYAQFEDDYMDMDYYDGNGAKWVDDGVFCRPMLWDMYRSYGAIYWCNEATEMDTGKDGINFNASWDINYRTYDFNIMCSYANNNNGTFVTSISDIPNTSDACFVRLVDVN